MEFEMNLRLDSICRGKNFHVAIALVDASHTVYEDIKSHVRDTYYLELA